MKASREMLDKLCDKLASSKDGSLLTFNEVLAELKEHPKLLLRNIFQYIQDMVTYYVPPGTNEFPDDPENIGFVNYDMDRLFVHDTAVPFFSDRLFSNRFMEMVESLGKNIGQNKICILEGPHGCGKSTCLNNLLRRLEDYSETPEGYRYEVVWKINTDKMGGYKDKPFCNKPDIDFNPLNLKQPEELIIPCPNHCNPLLLIPVTERRWFIREILGSEMAETFEKDKKYEWFFKGQACTVCEALARVLIDKARSPCQMFEMLHARRYRINRRHGVGAIVYNPSDEGYGRDPVKNRTAQTLLNSLLGNSDLARLEYAKYADSNGGVLVLMDLKDKNINRFQDLHNVLSEGYCRIGRREEKVETFFIAAANPEQAKRGEGKDKEGESVKDDLSFRDRQFYLNSNYVLEYGTEVKILANFFGEEIKERFLPRVLDNYAKVIIASRMEKESRAINGWIKEAGKYNKYCDPDLLLLRMAIYSGQKPSWLSEEDVATFTAKVRRAIIAESVREGKKGFSGRKSLEIFQNLHQAYPPGSGLITMAKLQNYFTKQIGNFCQEVPKGFLDSLIQLYDFSVLQEVKKSLFDYNEENIKREVLNYLFAISYDVGSKVTCPHTGDDLEVTHSIFDDIEHIVYGHRTDSSTREDFRITTQKRLVSEMTQGTAIEDTDRFRHLFKRYMEALHKNTLNPFLDNDNFRQAAMCYGMEKFETYDWKIKENVGRLMQSLMKKFGYSVEGARTVCVYVVEKDLAKRFAD